MDVKCTSSLLVCHRSDVKERGKVSLCNSETIHARTLCFGVEDDTFTCLYINS